MLQNSRFIKNVDQIVMSSFCQVFKDRASEKIQPSTISLHQSFVQSSHRSHDDNNYKTSHHDLSADRELAQPIYYKQYSSFTQFSIKPQLDIFGKVNFLQNTPQIEKYDSSFLNSFIYQWRIMAQDMEQKLQKQKKELHLTIKEIDIDQRLNLIKPIIVLKLKKDSDDPMIRIVNGYSQASNGDGEYFSITLQCKIKSRRDNTSITWNFLNEDSEQFFQKNGNLSRTNTFSNMAQPYQQETKIILQEFQPNDILQIELRDQGMNSNQERAYVTKQLYELYSREGYGKRVFVDLDFREINLYQQCNISMLSVDSFLSPSVFPESYSFEEDLETQIVHNLDFIDPIYGEYINLPNMKKQEIKILKNTLNNLHILDENATFLKETDSKELGELKKIKKNLITHLSRVVCSSYGQLKKNIELIVTLEEDLLNLKEANPNHTINASNIGRPSMPISPRVEEEK